MGTGERRGKEQENVWEGRERETANKQLKYNMVSAKAEHGARNRNGVTG